MTDSWVDVARRRLRVRVEGDGPAVVLEQGGGAGGVDGWPGVADELAQHATVLTYDRAGLGASDRPRRSPTADDMARDLEHVLDTCLPDQPVVLVGFSLGGLVAQVLACRAPQRVSALVLVDPTATEAYDGRRLDPAAVLTTAFRLVTGLGLGRGLVRRYVDAQLGPTAQPAVRKLMVATLSSPRFWKGVRLETARLQESCAQAAEAVRTQGLPDVPVVVLTAGDRAGTALRTRESHRRLAGAAPQGRLVVVEGARHNVVALRPDAVVAAVLDVLPARSPGAQA